MDYYVPSDTAFASPSLKSSFQLPRIACNAVFVPA